jgi:hypothetical protein
MRPRLWSGSIAVFALLCGGLLTVAGAQQAPPAAGQGGAQKPPPGLRRQARSRSRSTRTSRS